jgi:hypothetical protein
VLGAGPAKGNFRITSHWEKRSTAVLFVSNQVCDAHRPEILNRQGFPRMTSASPIAKHLKITVTFCNRLLAFPPSPIVPLPPLALLLPPLSWRMLPAPSMLRPANAAWICGGVNGVGSNPIGENPRTSDTFETFRNQCSTFDMLLLQNPPETTTSA